MKLSASKLKTLKAVAATEGRGIMWLPDKQRWFTPEGEKLLSSSVFSLAANGLLDIRHLNGVTGPKDYSRHHLTANVTDAAKTILDRS